MISKSAVMATRNFRTNFTTESQAYDEARLRFEKAESANHPAAIYELALLDDPNLVYDIFSHPGQNKQAFARMERASETRL